MNKKRVPSKKRDKTEKLWVAQRTFFIFGYTIWMDDSRFPFTSEEDRRSLWKQNKKFLQQRMYQPREEDDFRAPSWNKLRPAEYWVSGDAPEPLKLIADGALSETQYEFLERFGLLCEDDQKFIQTYNKQFWDQETNDKEYREYYIEQKKKDEERKLHSALSAVNIGLDALPVQ